MSVRLLAFLAILATLAVADIEAQIPVSHRDINPNQSTLDPVDPDGASGGRVNGLGAAAANPGTFYAASELGGIYRSTDNGLTWAHLDAHVPTVTWDVEVDPTDSNRVYATSFFDGRTTSVAGINVSTNGGVSWSHPASATPPANFCLGENRRREPSAFGIAVDPADPNDVYIGTNCGLAISTDRGVNWTFVDPTPADRAEDIWDVVVHDGSIIDLCGADGHQRSVDGGVTWTTSATAPLQAGRCSIAVSPDEPYVLFAVVGTTIFETDDAGQNWTNAYVNPSPQGRIPFVATNQRAGATYDLWFGDVSLHRATCTTPATPAPGGVARCSASAAWAGGFTRGAGGHDDTGDIIFDSAAATDRCPVLFSCDGGVYRNTIGASPACHTPAWEQPNITPHGLWNFAFHGVGRAGAAAEDVYMGNQDNGTFGTLTGGAAAPVWNNQFCCDGFDVAAEATRALTTVCCFGGGRATRLFLSAPGLAGPPTEINSYPPGQLMGFQQLENIVNFGPGDYAVITTSGVFVTDDVGASPVVWTQLGAGSSPFGACGIQVSFAAGVPTFFVKAGGCNGDAAANLWRHTGAAAGSTWTQVTGPGGGLGVYSVDAGDPHRIFASQLSGIGAPRMVLTRDGGTTWVNLSVLDTMMTGSGEFLYRTTRGPTSFTGFGPYFQPSFVALDSNDQDILAAGGVDSGLFLSVNGGTRWERVTDPLTPGTSNKPHIPRPRYAHFDHDPPGDDVNLFVGTQGRGAWRLTFTKILVPEIQVPPLVPLRACAGSSDHGMLNVCNTSRGDLIVSGISSSNPAFSVAAPSGGFPVSISHDFCFPFPVMFTPSAPGSSTADFIIASNDSSFPTLTVASSGTGTTADVRATGSTAFGVASAWTRSDKAVAVCNTGECPLSVTSASLGSCTDFALIATPFPASLPSSTCLDLGIEFTPTLGGLRSCTLTIDAGDPDSPVVTRTLTGRMAPFLTIHAGLAEPHGALNATADLGSTINLGLVNYWRPNWAWDLRLGGSTFEGSGGTDDTRAWSALANVRYSFSPAATVRPFLNAGGGLYHFRPGGVEGGINVGVGLGIPTGRRLSIEGSYNFHLVFTASPDLKYSQLQLGVKISF